MLIFTCPYCGIKADETDLQAGGEAHLSRHATGASDNDLQSYLFLRKNPKAVHFERWRHINGCGKWFNAARCTTTLEVFGTYSLQTLQPPADLIQKIKQKRPNWQGYK